MGVGEVGRLLRQCDLDRRRAPRNERRQLPLSDPQKRLMDLCWIRFSLYDVEDADVATCLARGRRGRDHAILRLQQSSHDFKHRGSSYCPRLVHLIAREGSVGGH